MIGGRRGHVAAEKSFSAATFLLGDNFLAAAGVFLLVEKVSGRRRVPEMTISLWYFELLVPLLVVNRSTLR